MTRYPDELLGGLLTNALLHDIHEVTIGDMPASNKEYRPDPDATTEERIIKLADQMQACWFIRQWGLGDHAQEVAEHAMGRLGAMIGAWLEDDLELRDAVFILCEELGLKESTFFLFEEFSLGIEK